MNELFEEDRERRMDIHLHIHFDDALRIRIVEKEEEPAPAPTPQPTQAVRAIITIGGNMPGQITVDTTNENVSIEFVDDQGNPTSAPDGAVVSFSSDNPAVVTVAVDPNNPLQGDISPVSVGAANISAAITDSSGAPLNEPSGQPFTVDPVQVTVSPGPAAGASLVLSA